VQAAHVQDSASDYVYSYWPKALASSGRHPIPGKTSGAVCRSAWSSRFSGISLVHERSNYTRKGIRRRVCIRSRLQQDLRNNVLGPGYARRPIVLKIRVAFLKKFHDEAAASISEWSFFRVVEAAAADHFGQVSRCPFFKFHLLPVHG
jgi:hypothetical protein